ncbi:MAG: arginase family protein [Gemmatimonadetes bacterium]|nr:arginase family protein [Gemmatimonadota bacterium]
MPRRRLVVLDAPTNLGLRPPAPGAVPGCYKAPWTLRDRGLLRDLRAEDGGAVVPARYLAAWKAGDGVRNADAIARYSRELADRVESILARRRFPLVLGGDCSVLLGNLLALRRRGRHGLVFLDAHSDFRHLGNSPAVGAAAGEDLALVTGRGDERLVDLEGLGPSVDPRDVAVVGVRPEDECLSELDELGMCLIPSDRLARIGATRAAAAALTAVTNGTRGFWVHLDADVVDAAEMPAVDCPETGGPSFRVLGNLLRRLVDAPGCMGLEVTIYDPDEDPDGRAGDRLARCLRESLSCDRDGPGGGRRTGA